MESGIPHSGKNHGHGVKPEGSKGHLFQVFEEATTLSNDEAAKFQQNILIDYSASVHRFTIALDPGVNGAGQSCAFVAEFYIQIGGSSKDVINLIKAAEGVELEDIRLYLQRALQPYVRSQKRQKFLLDASVEIQAQQMANAIRNFVSPLMLGMRIVNDNIGVYPPDTATIS